VRSQVLLVLGAASVIAAVQLVAVQSAAGADRGRALQVLSGPTPFTAGCPGGRLDAEAIAGSEVEPAVAVNPTDPRNIIATWQQDIGPEAARSDLIKSSRDGGRTWTLSTIPGLSVCTGGTADFASDPWLSAGVDGTVYFSGTTASATADPPPVAVVASRSTDRGRTWQQPTIVAAAEPGNDTDAVTASPTVTGHA